MQTTNMCVVWTHRVSTANNMCTWNCTVTMRYGKSLELPKFKFSWVVLEMMMQTQIIGPLVVLLIQKINL